MTFRRCRLLLASALFAAVSMPARAADVFVGVPPFNPEPGQQFNIELFVDIGPEVLGSYFFELRYDPAVVTVAAVGGGTTPGFTGAPTTDPTSFSSGVTPIAASQGNTSSPSGFVSVATVTLLTAADADAPGRGGPLNLTAVSLFDGTPMPLGTTIFGSSVLINFDPVLDPDGDGLNNQGELAAGTGFNDPDSDDDDLTDGYEVANFLNPLDDGSTDPNNGPAGDPDGDGFDNEREFEIGSRARDPRSIPLDFTLNLIPGLQPIFYPLDLTPGFKAFDLLALLAGGNSRVTAIESVQNPGGTLLAAALDGNGLPSGDNFDLAAGQGVMATVASADGIPFLAPIQCPVIDLLAGVNVVGLRCIPTGYDAFQMLADIGTDAVVTAVQRFNSQNGRFEDAAYSGGIPAGVNFPIQQGEAYLVHMRFDRPGFDPLQ